MMFEEIEEEEFAEWVEEEGKWINNFLFSNSRENSMFIKTFFFFETDPPLHQRSNTPAKRWMPRNCSVPTADN